MDLSHRAPESPRAAGVPAPRFRLHSPDSGRFARRRDSSRMLCKGTADAGVREAACGHTGCSIGLQPP